MKPDMLIAHITAQAPEMPAHKVSAYLLEFVETLRTQGKEDTVTIDNFNNQGHSARVPEYVMDVHAVYADGIAVSGIMSEESAMFIMNGFPDDYLTDLDPDTNTEETLLDDYGYELEE
ncbi:MAG TPA: hypothetical protein PL124_07505 [Candidatus Cloacimonadota bacterium]|nr:hypothetical protein [Candidatus Cloacimonadota bacterium]HPS39243.1 hypothetical protein [Candidatus Cloacimonadota bacterium]